MPRAPRSNKLEKSSSRLTLPKGERHFQPIGEGLALCYRRPENGGNGTWAARVIDRASRKQTFHKLAEADDHLTNDGENVLTFSQAAEKARELAKAPRSKGSPITVAEIATDYLGWFEKHRRGFKETKNVIEAHVLPAFGNRYAHELTAPMIREWHHSLAASPPRRRSAFGRPGKLGEKPKSPEEKRARRSTANRILTVMKAMLNQAYGNELIADDSPWRRVKPFEGADEPVIRFLTDAEATRLVNASRPDLRQLVKAALFIGARYSELTGLLVADVNPDTAMVYIRPSKSGKGRHVPLSAEGLDFFQTSVAGKPGKAHVFTRADGAPWGKNHHVRPLAEANATAKIEPPITFHDLRHTYASLLAQAGADLLTISKLLGHADTRVTSRHYAHLCDKTLANAVRTLLPNFGHKPDGKVEAIR